VEKNLRFVQRNLLLLGMVASVALAWWQPAVGRVGGPLRPEVTVNTIGQWKHSLSCQSILVFPREGVVLVSLVMFCLFARLSGGSSYGSLAEGV
jgi:hypothetical protein